MVYVIVCVCVCVPFCGAVLADLSSDELHVEHLRVVFITDQRKHLQTRHTPSRGRGRNYSPSLHSLISHSAPVCLRTRAYTAN